MSYQLSLPLTANMLMNAWIEQLKKEFKVNELAEIKNEIEGISYAFSDQSKSFKGWKSKYLNSQKTIPYSFHSIENVAEGRSNLMHDLNHGCEGIFITWNQTPDLNELFKDVQFPYVQTVLSLPKKVDLSPILHWIEEQKPQNLFIETELEEIQNTSQSIGYIIPGFHAYSSGANAWQELAYVAHNLEQFIRIKSARPITIEVGIGENVVLELSKFKALDWLTQSICEKHQHFPPIKFRCLTGWRNKTSHQVNDNQIRQTIESLSGLIAGVHELCVTPYDFAYSKTSDHLVRRMALNMVHILENEAQVNEQKSLLDGSVIIQHHAQWLCDQVWSKLQAIPANQFDRYLTQEIESTLLLRQKQSKNFSAPSTEPFAFRQLSGVFGGKAVFFQNLEYETLV